MKNTKELLGGRIRELRKGLKMSQEQLSEKIDVDPRYISRIELGHCFPSLETLENIARALNAEMKELFDYQHKLDETDYQEEIAKMLESAEDEKQRMMILKITKAVTRTVLHNF